MKRTLILLLALIGLAVIAWYLAQERGTGTLKKDLTSFHVADTSQVGRIFIAEQLGGTVDLKRTDKGWVVNDTYPAAQHNVDLLLKTFKRVEVRSPVPKSFLETVLKVMSSSGKKVEIYDLEGELMKTWYVGHATQDHFGTYMLLELPDQGRSDSPFIMGMTGFTGTLGPRFHAELGEWRSSLMIAHRDLGKVRKVEVMHPHAPGSSFIIEHDGQGRFDLMDGHGTPVAWADTFALQETLRPLKQLNWEYVVDELPKAKKDSIINSTPTRILRIETDEGAEEEHRFYFMRDVTTLVERSFNDTIILPQDPDRMYSVINDTELVVVQRHLFDRALPKLRRLQH